MKTTRVTNKTKDVEAEQPPRFSRHSLSKAFPSLGERLEALLKDRQITWAQLSRDTHLSRPTLYRLARGEGNPLLSNLVTLADYLRTTVTSLLGPQHRLEAKSTNADSLPAALLADPPRGDLHAREIYEAVCHLTPEDKLHDLIQSLGFLLPGESFESAATRAILDTFHFQLAWIDTARLPRLTALEEKIQKNFELPDRPELSDPRPVRVIDLDPRLDTVVQIHALAAVAAALIKELLLVYHILGLSDGFTVSTIQKFLRRSDLNKAELVPCTYTPQFINYELSGPTLIGSMARTHHGYRVRSTTELTQLKQRIEKIEVVVTSCGSILVPEPEGRLARLLRETNPNSKHSYYKLIDALRKEDAVGDLMYHFLTKEGRSLKARNADRALEKVELGPDGAFPKLSSDDAPQIYAVSPDGLAKIASRGVSLLIVQNQQRAAVARAALCCHAINALVMSKAAAEKLAELS